MLNLCTMRNLRSLVQIPCTATRVVLFSLVSSLTPPLRYLDSQLANARQLGVSKTRTAQGRRGVGGGGGNEARAGGTSRRYKPLQGSRGMLPRNFLEI